MVLSYIIKSYRPSFNKNFVNISDIHKKKEKEIVSASVF